MVTSPSILSTMPEPMTIFYFRMEIKYFGVQGFFEWSFKTVKRPQKLNVTMRFETQSSHQMN